MAFSPRNHARCVAPCASVLLGLVLVNVAAGCGRDGEAKPAGRPPPSVVVTKAAARDLAVTIKAPVELRPVLQADVESKALGYLDAVLASPGDRVTKGQLLALVRPGDLPDQLGAARGSLAQNDASLDLARANAARAVSLAPSGVVSQQELQQAQAAVARAEAEQAALRAQVSVASSRVGETRITAPYDGVVIARRLDPGALVGPGTSPILVVGNVDKLKVFVSLDERRGVLVQTGQKAALRMDALPDKVFETSVFRVYPTYDSATRTVDVDLRIDNAEHLLKPGMFGRATIVVGVHPNAVVVPTASVTVSAGKRWAFVLDGDKVRRREVSVGVDDGDILEITAGVTAGEEVVSVGMDNISNGSTVRVARPGAVASSGARDVK
jgi:RND family efflux transporter MFP subunit